MVKKTKTAEEQINDIKDEKLSDFIGEEVKDGKVVPDKNEVEEKAEEIKKTPKDEKPADEEVEVDVDELKREIKEETRKELTDKITSSLKGDQKEVVEDEYDKFAKETYEKLGRNPTYKEAFKFLTAQVKAEIRNEEEAAKVKADEEKTAQEKDRQSRVDAFNKYIDGQLDDLLASGKLPKIVDPKDEKDPGVVARKKLFQTMYDVNTKLQAEGKAPITSLKEIFYEHYTPPNRQPAGANAPVSAGRGGVQTEGDGEYSYSDIHKPKFVDFYRK